MAVRDLGIFNAVSAGVLALGLSVGAADASHNATDVAFDSPSHSISYAQTIDPTESSLSAVFSSESFYASDIYMPFTRLSGDIDAYETFDMASPWEKSLQERLSNLIMRGHYDEAYTLLETHLTGYSDMHTQETMEMFGRVLENLVVGGFGQQAAQFANLFQHSELGQALSFGLDGFVGPGLASPAMDLSFEIDEGSDSEAPMSKLARIMAQQAMQENLRTMSMNNPGLAMKVFAAELG